MNETMVRESIAKMVPGNISIEINPVEKNGLTLTGICARKDGSNAGPVVYWENYFGTDDEKCRKIAEMLLHAIEQAPPIGDIMDLINDRERFLANLYPLLLEKKAAGKSLLLVKDVNDALGLYLDLDVSRPEASASVKVTHSLLEAANIEKEEAARAAFKNVAPEIQSMNGVMMLFSGKEEEMVNFFTAPDRYNPDEDGPLLYVRNGKREYRGAAAILAPQVTDKIRQIFGGDFYILPSSIHEVIVVPADLSDASDLKQMVHDINRAEVAPHERLSDHVFLCGKDGVITVAA